MTDQQHSFVVSFFLVSLALAHLAFGEEVSFSTDLAEILQTRCSSCHGGNRPRRNLRIESYASFMKGSSNGPIVSAGKPTQSLLISKLKGEGDGDRMPPTGEALTAAQIAQFEQWISAGAKYDGRDRNTSLSRVVLAEKQKSLSADELSQEARETLNKNWALSFSNAEPVIHQSDHFLMACSKESPELEILEKLAEDAYRRSTKFLGATKHDLKIPISLYWLPKRYDFGEFAEMVEERTAGESYYWMDDAGAGYVVVGPDNISGRQKIAVDVGQLQRLTTSLLAHRWGAPKWYADGLGYVAWEKASRRSNHFQAWKSKATRTLGGVESAKSMMEGKLPAGDEGLVSWAFVRFLSSDAKRLQRLTQVLRTGRDFESTFAVVYGKPPEAIADAWLKRYRPKRRPK